MRGDSDLTDSQFLRVQKTFQDKQGDFFKEYEEKKNRNFEFKKKKLNFLDKFKSWFRKK
jgi:hypothetical protein